MASSSARLLQLEVRCYQITGQITLLVVVYQSLQSLLYTRASLLASVLCRQPWTWWSSRLAQRFPGGLKMTSPPLSPLPLPHIHPAVCYPLSPSPLPPLLPLSPPVCVMELQRTHTHTNTHRTLKGARVTLYDFCGESGQRPALQMICQELPQPPSIKLYLHLHKAMGFLELVKSP